MLVPEMMLELWKFPVILVTGTRIGVLAEVKELWEGLRCSATPVCGRAAKLWVGRHRFGGALPDLFPNTYARCEHERSRVEFAIF